MTLNTSTNVPPFYTPSNASVLPPNFNNIQHPSASFSSFQQPQQQQQTNTVPFYQPPLPATIPPFNFNMPNPQQSYYQPVPPPTFTPSQPSYQFNPSPINNFPMPQYTNINHGHSHECDGTGHGHSH